MSPSRTAVTATVTLRASWTASLVGHDSVDDMAAKLRESLLADADEVLTLPDVKIVDVKIVTDGVLRSSGGPDELVTSKVDEMPRTARRRTREDPR